MNTTQNSTPAEEAQLAPILKICQKMNSERDLSALLDLITREAAGILQAERASIFLLDPSKGELWSKVALGSEETLRFDSRLGIAGAVVQSRELINVADTKTDPRFYSAIDSVTGYQTKSVLAAPIRNLEGQVIGTFEVLNSKRGVFSARDEEILLALAAQAAVAIETAQLVEDLKHRQGRLSRENTQLWRQVQGPVFLKSLIGTSQKIQNVIKLIQQISDSFVNVLITGESGTGKEIAAKAIHYNSPRARAPLVALNCAALPENLVESELFGIERGVATGVDLRKGKFEEAQGGTLFLDEVGDLSLSAQAKLLRVLQEGTIERVGGRKEIALDVRVLSATNKDLDEAIKEGRFRQDLFYRLNVIHIQMPALREIADDIPLIANSLLHTYALELKKRDLILSQNACARMMAYSWPGNIRELQNEIKRLVICVPGNIVDESDLAENIRNADRRHPFVAPSTKMALRNAVADYEKQLIIEALEESDHNQQHTANALGLSRQGLIKKMKRYGIKT
jgi:Nif-specific regulatory protein